MAGVRSSGTPGTGSLAGAIGQVGKAVQQVGQIEANASKKRAAMDDELQFAIATQKFQEAALFETDVINRTDYTQNEPLSQTDENYFKTTTALDMSNRDKVSNDHIGSFENKVSQLKFGFKTKEAQTRFEAWKIRNSGSFHNGIRHAVNSKYADYQVAKFENLILDSVRNNDPETASHWVDVMAKNELITEVDANRRRVNIEKGIIKVQEQLKEDAINSILPSAIKLVDTETYDRGPAIEYIDQQTDMLVEQGLIDEVEAIEARNDLVNDVDDWRAERVSSGVKKTNEITTKSFSDLADAFVSGEATMDFVANLPLKGENLEDAQKYMDGYFKDAPDEPTPGGIRAMTETMMDYSLGRISQPEAYRELMENRYIDRDIDDPAFKSAVERVRNPFPRHYVEELKGAIDTIQKRAYKTGGWGKSSEERELASKTTLGVMNWAEEYFNKHKEYPTEEQLFSKARGLGVAIKSQAVKKTISDILMEEKEVQEAYNPKTGEVLRWDGEQWQKVQ